MALDKPFVIPSRDDDLLLENEHQFWIQNVSSEVDEFIEAIEAFEQDGYESLPKYLSIFYSMIKNYNIGDRKLRINLLRILGNNTQLLSTQVFESLSADNDDEDRKPLIRQLTLMYLYLFCRLFYVLETDYLKCTDTNIKIKKKGNAADANFVSSFVTDKSLVLDQLRDFICITIDSNGLKVSALKELFAGDIPVGIPRLVNSLVLKILSDPENQYARSEAKKLQPGLFEIMIFIGREWRFLKVVVKEFVGKLFEWDYYKKGASFVYINSFKGNDYSTIFLDSMINQFLEEKYETADKVRPFNLFIQSVAEHFPDVINRNFNRLYRLIRSEQGQMRSTILSVIEAVLNNRINDKIFDQDDEVYLSTIQQCLYDSNSIVRNKAMNVLKDLVISDFETKVIPTGFYGRGVLLDIGKLLADNLNSVRKTAAQVLDELLHRNPFGDNLNVDYLYQTYGEIVENVRKMKEIVDSEEFEEELNIEVEMQKEKELENEAIEIVNSVLKDYIDAGNFPERSTVPASTDDESICYVNASIMFKSEVQKKEAIITLANYFYQYVIDDRSNVDFDSISKQIVDILLKFHVGMTDANDEERRNYLAEQRKREKERKLAEEEIKHERILETLHYALQMEECMGFAVNALINVDKDVEAVVHFISRCRNFKLRGSESAIKQVCKLMYSKSDDIRKFVINSSKEVFFSMNSNEAISEQSTVQKMLEVMEGSNMEERCLLTDTLYAIFKKELLKKGSINILWELALGDDKEKAILSLQILYAHTLAEPKMTQKDFKKILEVLNKKDDSVRIEALKLAVAVGQRQLDEEKVEDLKERVIPPFRFPPTDEFFKCIIHQLMSRLTVIESKRWNFRARLTLKAIFNLCTSPDMTANMLIGPVLLKTKTLNSQYRVLRRLWLLSVKSLQLLRQKLLKKNLEVAFTISGVSGINGEIIKMSEDMKRLEVEETTMTQDMLSLTQQEMTDLDGTMNGTFVDGIPIFDTRKPEIYDRYHRFTYRKRRCQKKKILEGMKPDEALQFLKVPKDDEGNPMFDELEKRINSSVEPRLKDFKHIQNQCASLFVLMKNYRKMWQLVMKRMFFLVKEYITRTIFFVSDSMINGLEKVKSILEDVRKLPRGQVKPLQLPTLNKTTFLFERDNLESRSIYENSKGRMEDAVGQSVDSMISSHIREAIAYDLFKPGSIVARVYPITLQILRFRRRAPITSELSDAALGCLLKMMQASSRVCNYHLGFVFYYMKTAPTRTRANILTSLTDIAMCNTYSFSRRVNYFLASIHDKSPSVRLVALLTIHYLNSFKTIMLSDDNKAKIAMLLLDSNEHVVNLTKYVFHFMITECNVSVSGLIRDVFLRLYKYEVKQYDFKPVTEFFFDYIKSIAEAEATMTSICQTLSRLARENKDDKYMINYVVMVMDCLCLIYKSNSKMVQRLTAEMDKFRMFFKHPKVCKSLQQYIITLKKGSLDNNMGACVDGLQNKLKKLRDEMKFAIRYDTENPSTSKLTTPAPEVVDIETNEDTEMTEVFDSVDKKDTEGLPMSPKRKHPKDDDVIIRTKRLKKSLFMSPESPKKKSLNESPDNSSSSPSTIENDENRSRLTRSRCNSSTTDNSLT